MNKLNYESPSQKDVDFPGFEEYDIISGNEYLDVSQAKVQSGEDIKFFDDGLFLSSKSSVNFYEEEWNQLYMKKINIDELKKKSLDGSLQSNHFRSICWRCLLGILSSEPSEWLSQLKSYRTYYRSLWIELQQNPWNVKNEIPHDNPLSQEAESIWHKYFSNEELKSVIHQDVVRTFPGVNFFRKETIQEMMVRILFCYARQNPSLCYRQGMHEILAPLMYVLHGDHQLMLQAKEQNFTNNEIYEVLDPQFMEEDAYNLFKHVMNHIECSYRINNLIPTSTGYFPKQASDDKIEENEVIGRLQFIKTNILQESDPDLIKHLDELDIPMHLFGIRWLRLLFGREFPIQELLILWDAIFSITDFELVNYIVASMLTAIRPILLEGDYTSCLTNLMHYPPGVDVMFVIEYALYLLDPVRFTAPTVTTFSKQPLALLPKSTCTVRVKQTLENCDTSLTYAERLKSMPIRSMSRLSNKSHVMSVPGAGEGDGPIVEGFALDDPKVLKLDQEYLSSTLGIVQTKLYRYHDILLNNLAEPINAEVKMALDGIYELCSFLKTYQIRSPHAWVEPAFEAAETKQSPSKKKNNSRSAKTLKASVSKPDTLLKTIKKLPAGELKVFKQYEGGDLIGAPMADPLHHMKIREKNTDSLS